MGCCGLGGGAYWLEKQPKFSRPVLCHWAPDAFHAELPPNRTSAASFMGKGSWLFGSRLFQQEGEVVVPVCRSAGVEQLMYIKEDLIIPHVSLTSEEAAADLVFL